MDFFTKKASLNYNICFILAKYNLGIITQKQYLNNELVLKVTTHTQYLVNSATKYLDLNQGTIGGKIITSLYPDGTAMTYLTLPTTHAVSIYKFE